MRALIAEGGLAARLDGTRSNTAVLDRDTNRTNGGRIASIGLAHVTERRRLEVDA